MRKSNNQNDSNQTTNGNGNSNDYNGPDYIAMQYRQVRVDDGWKTRKERIGAAFNNANGSICFRPAGVQLIENDVYLFPNDSEPS